MCAYIHSEDTAFAQSIGKQAIKKYTKTFGKAGRIEDKKLTKRRKIMEFMKI